MRDAPVPPPQPARWRVRLLGAIEAQHGDRLVQHWPTRATAALLARLALAPGRAHPREELIGLLWPEVVLESGRNRLRQALFALKAVLDSDGGAVIQADRMNVRAAPGAFACDACDFETALRSGHTEAARRAYGGEFMPGHYDEWVTDERRRLAALFERLETLPVMAPPPLPVAASGSVVAARAGQLPNYWTRLFGIELNASRLRGLVAQCRLVTVLGAGGSGKTRLAVEAAGAIQRGPAWAERGGNEAAHFDRVAFVSLIDCTGATAALDNVASAFNAGGSDPAARIATALHGQRVLLVLDNFEQLVGHANDAIARLLGDSAGLHLLVTSRRRLGLDGEQVFELAGLALSQAPDAASMPPLAPGRGPAPRSPAVALFIDRATAARADFNLARGDDAVLAELVQVLAGMPLAIELAASRMRSLSAPELLAMLRAGAAPMLDVLTRNTSVQRDDHGHDHGQSHGQSQAQRHASMRHVVAWSWRQLSPPLLGLMRALATFASAAPIDIVAAVAGLDRRSAADQLGQLHDDSLLVAQPDARGAQRYALLQPVREFVLERTAASDAAVARQRLRQALIEMAQRCVAGAPHTIDEIDAELPLVYAAVQGAAADGVADFAADFATKGATEGATDGAAIQAVRLAVTLRRHWEIDTRAGLPVPVMQALDSLQATLDDAGLRCEALVLLSFSSAHAGLGPDAARYGQAAMALAPDARRRAAALLRWSQAVMFFGPDRSMLDASLAEALALSREVGDLEGQAIALRMQFVLLTNRDHDPVRGEPLAHQAQLLWERLGHRRNAYSGLMDRASCWVDLGRNDEAATALAACEQVARQERYATGYITAAWQLGRALRRLRQADAALAAFRRCVHGAWEHHRLAYVADALVLVPGGLVLAGQYEDAARLQGFAVAHWQRLSGPFYRDLERDVSFTRRVLRQHLGAVQLEALRLQGQSLSLPQAVALALGPLLGPMLAPVLQRADP